MTEPLLHWYQAPQEATSAGENPEQCPLACRSLGGECLSDSRLARIHGQLLARLQILEGHYPGVGHGEFALVVHPHANDVVTGGQSAEASRPLVVGPGPSAASGNIQEIRHDHNH